MSKSTVYHKRSSVSGKVPQLSDLSLGELAINYTDRLIYTSDGTEVFALNNITDAQATLEDILTVDGAGSGLDADLFDGLDGTDYLRLAQNDTITGQPTFAEGFVSNKAVRSISSYTRDKYRFWSDDTFTIGFDNSYSYGHLAGDAMTFQMSGHPTRGWWWGTSDDGKTVGSMSLTTSGKLHVDDSITVGDTGNFVYHPANDGIGSGMDSEYLGGVEWSDYALKSGVATGELAGSTTSETATGILFSLSGSVFGDDNPNWPNEVENASYQTELLGTSVRGTRESFPSNFVVDFYTTKIVINDVTSGEKEMWAISQSAASSTTWLGTNMHGYPVAADYVNGKLIIALGSGVSHLYAGYVLVDFANDSVVWLRRSSNVGIDLGVVADRNDATPTDIANGLLSTSILHDIALTLEADTPYDNFGMREPTILAATDVSVDIIRPDNTKVKFGDRRALAVGTKTDGTGIYAAITHTASGEARTVYVAEELPTEDVTIGNGYSGANAGFEIYSTENEVAGGEGIKIGFDRFDPTIMEPVGDNQVALGLDGGLTVVERNAAEASSGMFARVGDGFNTGLMVGDTVLSVLNGTTAGTVSDANLVPNGEIDVDVSEWLSHADATLTYESGRMRVASDTSYKYAYQLISGFVVGETYELNFEGYNTNSDGFDVFVGTTAGGAGMYQSDALTVDTTISTTFKATATTISLNLRNRNTTNTVGSYVEFDNISIKQVILDHSVKGNHLDITGSLIYSPVVTGSQMVALSGFSASNYAETTSTDFTTATYAYGWEETSGVWGFVSGTLASPPIDGLTLSTNTVKIEGTKKKALIRLSNTEPSADQYAFIEEQERHLFLENSLAGLGGTGDVTGISHDVPNKLTYIAQVDGYTIMRSGFIPVDFVAVDCTNGINVHDGHVYAIGDNQITKTFPTIKLREVNDDIYPIARGVLNDKGVLKADYTPEDVLAKLITVDGDGSNLDAHLLKGLDGDSYAKIDGDSDLTISKADPILELQDTSDNDLRFRMVKQGGLMLMQNEGANGIRFEGYQGAVMSGNLVVKTATGNHVIYHQGNDGDGSGIDADLLGGVDSTDYLRTDIAQTVNALVTFDAGLSVSNGESLSFGNLSARNKIRIFGSDAYAIGMGSAYTFGHLDDFAMTFQMSDHTNRGWWWGHENDTNAEGAMSLTTDGRLHIANSITIGDTASEVYHPGNDGVGSGMDADKLHGYLPDDDAIGDTIALRLSNGDLAANQLRSVVATASSTDSAASIIMRTNNTSNNIHMPINATGFIAWLSNYDGAGSNIDADLLDGVEGTSYLRSDVADICSASISFDAGLSVGTGQAITHNSNNSRDKFRVWNTSEYAIGMGSAYTFGHLNDFAMTFQMSDNSTRGFWWGHVNDTNAEGAMSLTTDGKLHIADKITVGNTTNEVYHQGNDGVGSGLDADLLGGLTTTQYLRSDIGNDGVIIGQNGIRRLTISNDTLNLADANAPQIVTNNVGIDFVGRANFGGTFNFYNAESAQDNTLTLSVSKAALTYKGNAIFHAGMDGIGSGIDAEYLGGYESSDFWRKGEYPTKNAIAAQTIDAADGNFFEKTITGTTTFTINFTGATASTATTIQVKLENAGAHAVNFNGGSNVVWSGGSAPTYTTSGEDIVSLITFDGGTTWFATLAMYGL